MIEGAKWRQWVYFRIPLFMFLLFLLFPFYCMPTAVFRPDGGAVPARGTRINDYPFFSA